MKGKIIKGIAGFYYVHTGENGIYTCKAKGIFRKEQRKPLVGDDVELTVLDETEKEGNIERLFPRRNELIRPAVANVDQALVIFAITKPQPNLNLLDRFLIMMEQQHVPSIICFNKQDIAGEDERTVLEQAYGQSGSRVVSVSAAQQENMDELRKLLRGKTTTVAGPSGVGKSSVINSLKPDKYMETGAISEKIDRGKHTTRHSELIRLEDDTYIMDTPGFTSLGLFDLDKEELRYYYSEFEAYEGECRFQGCVHIHEPDCRVKQALEQGKLSRIRYDNYCLLYEELKGQRKYGRQIW